VALVGDEIAFEALEIPVVDVVAARQPVARVRTAAVRVVERPGEYDYGGENGDDHDAPPGVRRAVALENA
jgi:hypothetical protein